MNGDLLMRTMPEWCKMKRRYHFGYSKKFSERWREIFGDETIDAQKKKLKELRQDMAKREREAKNLR